jgi:hypothetical protein
LPLGLTPDSVQLGDRVSIRGNPSRSGPGHIVLGRELTKADGTVLPLNIGSRSARAPSTAQAASIAGTWFSPLSSFRAFGGSQSEWQLTPQAQAAREAYDGTTQSAHAQCIPVTTPMVMVYPVVITVEVNPDTVVFNVDWMTTRRVVYLDGRAHPENGERTLNGHSIGHWEGDTLVIETANYSAGVLSQYVEEPGKPTRGMLHSAGLTSVERVSLDVARQRLVVEVWLKDPEFFTRDFDVARSEYAPSDLKLEPFNCSPEGVTGTIKQ